MSPDPVALAERVAMVSAALKAHAGGLTLEGADDEGRVTVRFTGMCTGCPARPLTMAATVRPALARVEGVVEVVATGSRISAEAEERLQAFLVG